MNRSIFYQSPRLYIWGLQLIHKGNFAKRYRYMASFVEPGDRVLEPGCGPAILADFLPKGASYRGFDTNKEFLNYASKKQDVFLANALDPKSYSQAEVVAVCDLLHHLHPKDRKNFIKYCFRAARKKLIICEPVKEKHLQKGFLSSLRKRLAEWSEQDGTGNFKVEHFMTKAQYLKKGFGVIPNSVKRSIKIIGEDVIVIFEKRD